MPTARQVDRVPRAVLALGASTVVSAIAAVVFLSTYEGVGLIGYRTAAAAAASALCFVLTVAGFVVTSTRDRFSRTSALGFACALAAIPLAMVVGFVVVLIRMALGLE